MKHFGIQICSGICTALMLFSSVSMPAAPLTDENTVVQTLEMGTDAGTGQSLPEESSAAESLPEETSNEETLISTEPTTTDPSASPAESPVDMPETTEAVAPTEDEGTLVNAIQVEAKSEHQAYLEGFVARLYEKCLGRTALADEINFWVNCLDTGEVNGAEAAYGFVFSEEYKGRKTDDASYVAMLYRTILGRDPKNGEEAGWVDYLGKGSSRQWIFEGFVNSDEYTEICARYQVDRGSYYSDEIQDKNPAITSFVVRLYQTCLGRRPDEQGLQDWVSALLRKEMTGIDAAWGFIDSKEMQQKNLDNSEYLDVLYRVLMDRTADAGGRNTWLAEFDKGVSRRYIASGFLCSKEFGNICQKAGIDRGGFSLSEARDLHPDISAFVKQFYQICFNRTPGSKELNDWVGGLAKKTHSSVDFALGFFCSQEYKNKNKNDEEFISDIYLALLGRPADASGIADWQKLLNNGWSRESLVTQFAESQEYVSRCEKLNIARIKDGWLNAGNKTYYIQNGGKVSGWKTINGKKYYFDPSAGNARATGWAYADGLKYYFNSDGTLRTDLEGVLGEQSSYRIKVNRQCNTVTVYAKDGTNGYIIPVKSFICSTGAGGATPLGTFTTPNKYRWHELMNKVYGQWCTRIVGGVLFHSVYYHDYTNSTLYTSAYNQLGSSVSHGCVRLTAGDAKWIYDNCSLGTTVVVYDSSVAGPYGKPSAYTLPSWHTWDPTDPTASYKCDQKGCH